MEKGEREKEKGGRKSAEKSTEQPLKENPSKSPFSSSLCPLRRCHRCKEGGEAASFQLLNRRGEKNNVERKVERKERKEGRGGMCFSKKNPFLTFLFPSSSRFIPVGRIVSVSLFSIRSEKKKEEEWDQFLLLAWRRRTLLDSPFSPPSPSL